MIAFKHEIKYLLATPLMIALILMSFIHCKYPFISNAASKAQLIRDIEITNAEMEQFDSNIYTYTVELKEGEKIPNFNVTPHDEDITIEINGNNDELLPGENRDVTVEAHDRFGNTCLYHFDIHASSDFCHLSFLSCTNGSFSPQFKESIKKYYIVIPSSETHASLDIRTKDPTYKVEVLGNEDLPAGERSLVLLNVTDTRGVIDKYEIRIYRSNEISANIKGDYLLKSVSINAGAINVDFNKKQFYYRIPVPNSISNIKVSATPENGANVVEVIGTSTLSNDHRNIITVLVYNPDNMTTEKSVYTFELYYDSFRNTPKYSNAQVLVLIIITLTVSFLIWFLIYFLHKKRNNNDLIDTNNTENTINKKEKHSEKERILSERGKNEKNKNKKRSK